MFPSRVRSKRSIPLRTHRSPPLQNGQDVFEIGFKREQQPAQRIMERLVSLRICHTKPQWIDHRMLNRSYIKAQIFYVLPHRLIVPKDPFHVAQML